MQAAAELCRGFGLAGDQQLNSNFVAGALPGGEEQSLVREIRHQQMKILTARSAHLRACEKLEEAKRRGEPKKAVDAGLYLKLWQAASPGSSGLRTPCCDVA